MNEINLEPFFNQQKHLVLRHFLRTFPQYESGNYKPVTRALFATNNMKLISTPNQGSRYDKHMELNTLVGFYTPQQILEHPNNFYIDIKLTLDQ